MSAVSVSALAVHDGSFPRNVPSVPCSQEIRKELGEKCARMCLPTGYFVIEESFCQSPFCNFRTVQRNINKKGASLSKLFISV